MGNEKSIVSDPYGIFLHEGMPLPPVDVLIKYLKEVITYEGSHALVIWAGNYQLLLTNIQLTALSPLKRASTR